jgi:hypothetical protein
VILPLTGDVLKSAWPWVQLQLTRYDIAYSELELFMLAQAGHVTVWSVIDRDQPIAVVMLAKHEDGTGEIIFAAGELSCLPEVIDAALGWCDWNDVYKLYVAGRKGWQRILKPFGFTREADKWALVRKTKP